MLCYCQDCIVILAKKTKMIQNIVSLKLEKSITPVTIHDTLNNTGQKLYIALQVKGYFKQYRLYKNVAI